MTSSFISTFAVVVVLGALAISAFSVGYNTSAEQFDAAEQITLSDAGNLVDKSDVAFDFGANVTVTYNGSTLEEGVDYRWNESTGEIERLNGSSVPDGASVSIDYQFNAPDDTTKDVNKGMEATGATLPFIALAAAVLVIAGWLS
ncbi:hypothetical protein [Halogeometricum sp. CBA1124]|uniref:hypothetical protein n=1 Tax=Halogeometricum sp. CBA1124 TaxID=2668071 RepID=UPI00142B93D5|nr:hypothetical protein [Halogeometricum sp. CBA1124]MUV57231.1 hypothetical protein [Halogeometricum sp. CBA1124]